jgi:hypothetical protein
VAGEGGAGAVVGEHVVEDVDEGGPVVRGELVELGESFAEQGSAGCFEFVAESAEMEAAVPA